MKVISGGIPGVPQHTTKVGDVYAQLHRIAFARGEQLNETERLTKALGNEITDTLNVNYESLNLKLSEHMAKEGPQHGEDLKTLGLSMVGDFPLTHAQHILEGGVYNEYVTPRALSDALHQTIHTPTPELMSVGRTHFCMVDLAPELSGWTRATGESGGTQQWERGGSIYHLDGHAYVGFPIRGKSTSMLVDETPGAKQIHGLRQVGVRSGAGTGDVLGWNAIALREYRASHPLTFLGTNGFAYDALYAPIGHDLSNTQLTANHVTWLDTDNVNNHFGGTISANSNGVRFGLIHCEKAVSGFHNGINGGSFFGWGSNVITDSSVFQYTFEGQQSTDSLIDIDWETLTGKTGIVFDHESEVHGGFEWIEYNRDLFIFLSANLTDADGNKYTAFFGWIANVRDPSSVTITRLRTPFDWSDSATPQLNVTHPFHPYHGSGAMRPRGGHASVYTYNLKCMVRDHVHEIRSLKELFDRCKEIPSIPVSTNLKLHFGTSPSVLGSSQGRFFLQNDHTLINGQFKANGEWDFYRQEFQDGMLDDGGFGGLSWNTSTSSRLISELEDFNQECVNTIADDGTITLTGMVWSTDNLHRARGTIRGVVGKGMLSKPVHLTDESLTAIEKEHQSYLIANDHDAYACVMVYPVGDLYEGLGMRCDSQGNVEVVKYDVAKSGERFQVTRKGDYQNVYQSEGPVTGAPDNLRRFLKRDFFVYLVNGETPKVTIKHPLMDRTLILRLDIGETITVEETLAPEPNEVGLTLFYFPFPTIHGVFMPVLGGLDGFYRLGDKSMTGGNVVYSDDVYANDSDRVVIKGRPYSIPPGFKWLDPYGKEISFNIKDGELNPETSDNVIDSNLSYPN
ncbi:hypothetical protein [Photobacterium phage PDCC-1]|uniref:Uncharacterized protein n=1 Tax=Photobacterium phage PDCC-1 TaxID=2664246 RepID=A0A6B9J3S4_9CAUD|nr:hypothetical protein HWC77_gp090 [Photobacterium phage PDCC-1]QGZ14453.1 hypothetical protein [Photobacterium phage PDCC-1]